MAGISAAETVITRAAGKRILIAGDALLDEWVHGRALPSQDGCPKFVQEKVVRTPGGAAGAARQLEHWPVEVRLIDSFAGVKRRFLDGDRILFRHDDETPQEGMATSRRFLLHALREQPWDAVLLSDYDKGFLTDKLIEDAIGACLARDIPIIVDPKRAPECCQGAVLKCNGEYPFHYPSVQDFECVVTHGAYTPSLYGEHAGSWPYVDHPVLCRNHVGAGDCFGSHLALCLACRIPLPEAARIAHAAGRVYVQHPHGRPPWPYEIRKDLDPVGGKILWGNECLSLRQNVSAGEAPGRIVFTNGVFRLGVHAGHAWFLRWAKQQGDVLVVGVNDDVSARQLRNGQHVLPLAERLEMLAGLECVDWIIPFQELAPTSTIRQLQPDALVKGSEYRGTCVPGDELVKDMRFAPESPFPAHCTDLETAIRTG